MAFSPRRLAAVDMRGQGPRRRRGRVVLVELIAGCVLSAALGIYLVTNLDGLGLVAGIWVLSIALNYLPLAVHAIDLSRPGALDAELAGVDARTELARYASRQFWVFVPGVVAVAALAELVSHRHRTETGGT